MADIIDVSIGGDSSLIEAAFSRVAGLGRTLGASLEAVAAPLAGTLGIALGGATVASLIALGVQATALGKEIKNLSDQTGLTIDEFETLAFLARENGSSADQASKAVIRLRDSLAQAETGSKTARDAFAAVGINWRELVDIPIGDALMIVARAMATAETDTRVFGALCDLLGTKNLPALQVALKTLGSEGWQVAGAEAEKAGQKLGGTVVEDLNKANQAIENMTRAIRVFIGKDVIGGWQEILRDDSAEKQIIRTGLAMQSLISAQTMVASGAASYREFAVALADYLSAIRSTDEGLTETHLRVAELGVAAQRKYYEEADKLSGETLKHIEGLEKELADKRSGLAAQQVSEAREVAAETIKHEKQMADAAKSRTDIIGEMLRNLADERVKPLLDLQRQLGMAIETGFEVKPITLFNTTMDYLNSLLKEGKLTQEQFAEASNLAADALARVTTQRTPAEQLAETLRKLKVESDQGRMSAEAYAEAVASAQAKFTTQRTAGEALAETYRKLRVEFDNGQMSQEAYTRAMEDAAAKAATVKTPLEAYNARVRELNNLHADGLISQEAYTRGMEDAASSLRAIKDPIEIYTDRLRDLKRMADDGTISQVALAKAIRDAAEAAGAAALADVTRDIGISEGTGTRSGRSAAEDAREYITEARAAAARGNTAQATWLFEQAKKQVANPGTTLEEILGTAAGGGGAPATPGSMKDSEGRDPWDLGYTGPEDPAGAAGAGAGEGMDLSPDAAAIVAVLKTLAGKLGVFE